MVWPYLVLAGLAAAALWLWIQTVEPSFGRRTPDRTAADVDPARLEADVRAIVALGPRDFAHLDGLERVSHYVFEAFEAAGGRPRLEPYKVGELQYYNVSARYGPETGPRLVVGAHYDTAGPLPGADDNASGVAGVLALARLLAAHPPERAIELVAYCLEEPPYFRTPAMGSAVHAGRLRQEGVELAAMFSLEMIGYFRDEPASQGYPMPLLRRLYPGTGNFIAVVGTWGQRGLGGRVARAMRAVSDLPVEVISAPRLVIGVDFSDHANYWDAGYPALMITDTSFYRNAAYHTEHDTPDTLDYPRMARVVEGVWNALLALSRP